MEILSRNQGNVSGGLLHRVRTKVPKRGSGGAELEWFLLSSGSFNSSSVLIRPDYVIFAHGGPVSAKMPMRRQAILDARSGPRGRTGCTAMVYYLKRLVQHIALAVSSQFLTTALTASSSVGGEGGGTSRYK